jgi:hypothetical protein
MFTWQDVVLTGLSAPMAEAGSREADGNPRCQAETAREENKRERLLFLSQYVHSSVWKSMLRFSLLHRTIVRLVTRGHFIMGLRVLLKFCETYVQLFGHFRTSAR